MTSKRQKNSRGSSLVETTLILLVFLTLLIGTVDVGQVLFIHQTLVERTRAAARYGALHPFDATAIQNMVLYNRPTAPEGARSGIFGLTPSMVSAVRRDATYNEDRVVVTISNYRFYFFTPLIAGAMRGKPIVATFPYEREGS
jgi:hypothetical protein